MFPHLNMLNKVPDIKYMYYLQCYYFYICRSGEWETIEPGSVPHANIDDGEFWISLKDFIHFFSGVTVCSVVPDVDRDGCTDSLSKYLYNK